MRRAGALALALIALGGPARAGIVTARYDEPVTRYDHGILGDAVEWGSLVIGLSGGATKRIRLPETMVFEDTAPRLADLYGDGAPEVLVVETSLSQGARLAVYGEDGRIAATPFIGRPYRWLAPIGAADLDGDGLFEIAYVDRPHLAKTIRVWRYREGDLEPVGDLAGYSNHRIGETDIAGGIRHCGAGPEMIVASGDWADVVAVRFDGAGFTTRVLGPHEGRGSFAKAMGCDD